jgi:hypothetical protein
MGKLYLFWPIKLLQTTQLANSRDLSKAVSVKIKRFYSFEKKTIAYNHQHPSMATCFDLF